MTSAGIDPLGDTLMFTLRVTSLVAATLVTGLVVSASSASAAPRHHGHGPHHRPGHAAPHRHGFGPGGARHRAGFRLGHPRPVRVIVRGGRTIVVARPVAVVRGPGAVFVGRPAFAGYGGRCTVARHVASAPFGHKIVTVRTCFVPN